MEADLKRRRLVVSAINFTEGGPLTILRECLAAAACSLPPHWDIFALVNDAALINDSRITTLSFPDSKRSWLRRLRYEWFDFLPLSRSLKPDLWLSLHDITPRVITRRQAVYCHNPSPFYRLPLREARLEPTLLLFRLLYQFFYRAFIKRNDLVIVQQDWLRKEFRNRFGNIRIMVAHPSLPIPARLTPSNPTHLVKVFLYPALARTFKNFEVIFEAVRILANRRISNFEIRLTLRGDENRYARQLLDRFGTVPCVKFIGRQTADQMQMQYREADAILFPSKLETWGLPISEAKSHAKPILVADLPYAHETVGTYGLVSFFPATDATSLADLMQLFLEGRWHPSGAEQRDPEEPFARDWHELWAFLAKDL